MRTWTKRDPVKNYFPLPNEIYQLGLSHGAIAVYGYLLRIEDHRTYQCHPSYATIGKAVSMSVATVPNEPHPNPDAAHSVGNASPCTTSKFASQNKERKPARN